LTFGNTGLGRGGFSAKAMKEFNAWYLEQYGSLPIYSVDAAQGGITFGLNGSVVGRHVTEARDALGEVAICMTLDPHKTCLPVPASVWLVKDGPWAKFPTARAVGHSYLEVGDGAVLREAMQLSTPLATPFSDLLFVSGLESGRHRDMFNPVIEASKNAYFGSHGATIVQVTVAGRHYRMLSPFDPHSGILGVCFVPLEPSESMASANEALKRVREYLSKDRNTPISCSGYSLGLDAFAPSAIDGIKENFVNPEIDWSSTTTPEFLRFVFRQGGQDRVVLEDLPRLITEKFGAV
jgi:hypothetical protein